jgi:predicted acetyltransferase
VTREIRHLRSSEEMAEYAALRAYAFNDDRSDEALARFPAMYERDWCMGVFEDGALTAALTIIPFEQYINGGRVPLGGVATVASAPERRRSGNAGALLRAALQVMRERGQALSGLYTPHYSLYRRYGWEIASSVATTSFPPKLMRVRGPHGGGHIERVRPDAWPRLHRIYTERHAQGNGALVRDERRWRRDVLADNGVGERDAAIWVGDDGSDGGYVVYAARHHPSGSPRGETTLRVYDWAALDAAAYAGLLRYLLAHDLADRITMPASPQEPLWQMFEEPRFITTPRHLWFGIMLRIVDVERAIAARPALPQADGSHAVIELADDAAPWNAGRWRIAASAGRMCASRTTDEPELTTDARALAAMYNGYLAPADAARCGALGVRVPDALARLSSLFAVSAPPYCADEF